MKKTLFALLACNAFVAAASAYNVSFDLEADRIRTSTGAPVPTTGICLLVASTTDTNFSIKPGSSLTVGSFLDGSDDQILYKANLASIDNTAGVFAPSFTINTANFSASLDGNDPLILYWFPTLTTNSTTIPNTATSYGAFRTTLTQDNGQSWVMPATQTANYRLYFLTNDAATYGPGTHLPSEANAAFATPAPEPSTYAMLLLAGLGGVALRRRIART